MSQNDRKKGPVRLDKILDGVLDLVRERAAAGVGLLVGTAILVFNSAPGEPIVMGGDFVGGIPGAMIRRDDGTNIKNAIDGGETVNVTLDAGIRVARRTVAKYRESMGIGSSSERRRAYRR